jgi:Tol biopolymer transport system component
MLTPGDRLGPYEIVRPVGSGGMGEVYRARDSRLRRDVAIKVLRGRFPDPEQVNRLAREARATGALNHPNIVAIFDIGTHEGSPFVVSELLEGESLRDRLLRGVPPYRKALDYGAQIAQALAAAHSKGIYHRDVKPGNLFLTPDGRMKLLDFGLAKLQRPEGASPDDSTASASDRQAGLGTVGYMAPEQIVGGTIDERTDIFALGVVLYEMLTGTRAFKKGTPADTLSAILNEDPVDPRQVNPTLPLAAAAVVRRCLEKRPEERFHSALDLAFHLQQLDAVSAAPPPQPSRRSIVLMVGGAAAIAAAVTLYATYRGWIGNPRAAAVTFDQISFRRGRVGGARLTPDGVVYSQAVADRPLEVSLIRGKQTESLPLEYDGSDVLAVHGDRLGLSLNRRFLIGERFIGTFAVAEVGSDPLELVANVEDADWDRAGEDLALAVLSGEGAASSYLEYPQGKHLYTSPGSIHFPRVSPDGNHVAFLEDLSGSGSKGHVVVVDRAGSARQVTREWDNARGLAWSPSGREVWYTASEKHAHRVLRAIDLDGRERIVLDGPGALTIWDASADGRVLVTREDNRKSLIGVLPGEKDEQDLSWFDGTGLGRLSADGKFLVFGDRFGIYTRPVHGKRAKRMGFEGAWVDDLSPDGRWILATSPSTDALFMVPTGAGTAVPVPNGPIKLFRGARWFPDGRRLLINGKEAERSGIRSYILDLAGGAPRPLTPEGTWGLAVSPDGMWIAGTAGDGLTLWSTTDASVKRVPGSEPGDRPVGWTADREALWIYRRGQMPALIQRLDLATGKKSVWRKIKPSDLTGVYSILDFDIAPDGSSYLYSYHRVLSELFVVRGVR